MRVLFPVFAASLGLALAACQPAATTAPAAPVQAAGSAGAASERQWFQCGELALEATYRGPDRATVVVAGRTLQMQSQRAASGAKYADEQGNVFWGKGSDEAVLSLKGEPDRHCQAGGSGQAVQSTAPAGFRATGNEPGWSAEIHTGSDGKPSLRVDVDYGERRFEVAEPAQGADGWIGKAADGTSIKLSFQRVLCEDDMSGQPFQAQAMLTVGTRQYHGCGSFMVNP